MPCLLKLISLTAIGIRHCPCIVIFHKAKQSSDEESDDDDDHGAQKTKALLRVNSKQSLTTSAILKQAGKSPTLTAKSATVNKSAGSPNKARPATGNRHKRQPQKKISSDDEDEEEDDDDSDDGKKQTSYRKTTTTSLNSTAISRLVSSKNDRKPEAHSSVVGASRRNGDAIAAPATASVLVAEVELRRNFIAPKTDKVITTPGYRYVCLLNSDLYCYRCRCWELLVINILS